MRKPALQLVRARHQPLGEARWIAALHHPLITYPDVDGYRAMQPNLKEWLDATLDPQQYNFFNRTTYIPGLTIVDAGSIVFNEDDAAFAFRMRWC